MTEPDVEIVVAHQARVVVRCGDAFLKIDPDRVRVGVEVAAMARAEVPTPDVLWHEPPVLALARLGGRSLAASNDPAAWRAAGEVARRLHDQPVSGEWPAWYGADTETFLSGECRWLVDTGRVPIAVVERCERVARRIERPVAAVVAHGDLQPDHVFVDEHHAVTGVIDWADACLADPLFDVAVLTLRQPERLSDLVEGYGEVDRDMVEAWWMHRLLGEVRWLVEHGYEASGSVAALARAAGS